MRRDPSASEEKSKTRQYTERGRDRELGCNFQEFTRFYFVCLIVNYYILQYYTIKLHLFT